MIAKDWVTRGHFIVMLEKPPFLTGEWRISAHCDRGTSMIKRILPCAFGALDCNLSSSSL